MFMMFYRIVINKSCLFLEGKRFILVFVCSSIILWILSVVSRIKRLLLFLCAAASLFKFDLFLLERETLVIFCVQQHYSLKFELFFMRCFLCVTAFVSKCLAFFSGERDSHCFLCASALFFNIWPLFFGERDCQCFCCAPALLIKTCGLHWERGMQDIVELLQNLFSDFV